MRIKKDNSEPLSCKFLKTGYLDKGSDYLDLNFGKKTEKIDLNKLQQFADKLKSGFVTKIKLNDMSSSF